MTRSAFIRFTRSARGSAVALALALTLCGTALAQARQGVYAPGEAAVTGFSGAVRPFEIEPGQDPEALTFINPEGPSLRVIDLRRMRGAPRAQLVGAAKPFTVSAKWIGQVFGVALDDATPPNIYAAATSVYGLSIVVSGPDGKPRRSRTGAPGAEFMPGQWGPGGGPGSIWKIDGATGKVSLFATITTGGKANSGAALGGLAYDPGTKSLFVADRETGLVHRLSLNGEETGVFDHGIAGPASLGLPPVPAEAKTAIDITSRLFDSARPDTWSYAPPERRVFGLTVHGGRVYYAVASGLRIWSVGLKADGSFGADSRIELSVPPAAGPTEISRITFDEQGRIYLAERPAPTGTQNFEDLSVPAIGRVLRYAAIGTTSAGQPIWQPLPDEYSIGFPERFQNANGGVAIGYRYDQQGNLDLSSCGGFVWSTGEQLRHATDTVIAVRLGQNDASYISGLQGNPAWTIRRDDDPPWTSYFIDYADAPPDAAAWGHMGDIAILRTCEGQAGQQLTPMTPNRRTERTPRLGECRTRVCDPEEKLACPDGQVWSPAANACVALCAESETLVNGTCCAARDLRPDRDPRRPGICSGNGTNIGLPQCGAGQTALGSSKGCCANDRIYAGPSGAEFCCATPLINGTCELKLRKPPALECVGCCATGYVALNGTCCLQSQATSTGQCCPAGEYPSADKTHCVRLQLIPRISMCCAQGFLPTGSGKCCSASNITSTGACCALAVDPKDRTKCPAPLEKKSIPLKSCGPGKIRNSKGVCVEAKKTTPPPALKPAKPQRRKCKPDEVLNDKGDCVKRKVIETPPRQKPKPLVCPPGTIPGPLGKRCLPLIPREPAKPKLRATEPLVCPRGSIPDATGKRCVPNR